MPYRPAPTRSVPWFAVELVAVSDHDADLYDRGRLEHVDGLIPGAPQTVHDVTFATLPRPPGELLARFATVNDVHFGELECGRIDDDPRGPIRRAEPGQPPYTTTMNDAAAMEIAAAEPDALIVKGDVSADGTEEQFAEFERCYRDRFGDRLHVVRGNHDAYRGQHRYAGDQVVTLPGITVAVLDTVWPEHTTGRLLPDQLDWLDTVAAESVTPVFVVGHHQQWIEGPRSADYFGIDPDSSDALAAVIERRRNIVAYSAGHTHRHRVRRTARGVPSIEVGCVKDFPGTWADHFVYETGMVHVVHRIAEPAALAWSESCRTLYRDFGIDYAAYALGSLEERCFTIRW